MSEKPKKYAPTEQEAQWMQYWEEQETYVFDPEKLSGKPYVIDTPPPTMSGKMHIGHAFSYAQQDFIARYRRMKGDAVCYPFGTDDNGLPTEKLVEKTHKVRSTSMERHEFIALCNKTIDEMRPAFVQSWKDLGMSCDFGPSYSTINDQCRAISQAAFLDLFEKGLVHQEESPVMWDVTFQTAVAQAELENVEKASHFNDIIFSVEGEEDLIIGTTRPELLPSCVAVFVHPDDKRYTHYVGKQAKPPLMDYSVPILADPKADPEKGTGAVMCCTFGDKVDIDWWREHKLPIRVSIGKDGRMTELAGPYAGQKIKAAREAIIADLKEAKLLVKQKDIVHPVNTYEKSGTEIEFLNTKQWFVNVLASQQKLLDLADKIEWYPKHMKARYIHWVENLNWDWCISRQRHFGVPFPVWYDKEGNVVVASREQLPVDPLVDKPLHYEGNVEELTPEKDVMDTWATSSVTPQIITNWMAEQVPAAQGKYKLQSSDMPVALRPQAHDIIRTWAFYTMIRGEYNNNSIPWNDIVISGHVLDPKGQKMSKSKGNVIDPQLMFEKYGADALRFWAATSQLGEDIPFQEKELVTGKKTVLKLWNASSFAAMHLESFDRSTTFADVSDDLHATDKWVLAKLNEAITKATTSLDSYEYARARHATDHFFWKVLCDNYLEIVKDRLYKPEVHGESSRRAAQWVLHTLVSSVIKLFAPIMPFVTEACYQFFFKEEQHSVHLSRWPSAVELSDVDVASGDRVVDIIALFRKQKGEQGLSLNKELSSAVLTVEDPDVFTPFVKDIAMTIKADTLSVEKGEFGVSFVVKEEN